MWLPKEVEGKNVTIFVEELLRSLLPDTQFYPYFTLERAHHSPPQPGPQGSPSRTQIFRVLNFRDRDQALQAARVEVPEC